MAKTTLTRTTSKKNVIPRPVGTKTGVIPRPKAAPTRGVTASKGGRKPTAAELAGIEKRSRAKGLKPTKATILATWNRDVGMNGAGNRRRTSGSATGTGGSAAGKAGSAAATKGQLGRYRTQPATGSTPGYLGPPTPTFGQTPSTTQFRGAKRRP